MKSIFLPLFSLMLCLICLSSASANTAKNVQDAATVEQEPAMPDAMSRLIRAPTMDLIHLRDPFLSSFEKSRMEEAKLIRIYKAKPINARPRGILERFDLSTLTIVGTYKKQGQDWVASIQDSTGKAYTVRRGHYLGKRSGRIEKIDGSTVYLVEKIINPAGDSVDRQVTLTLSEVND
ncbi:MAG: pilus assembly protein PilP [Mariprofundaceae bacterium]|nr:pilus assembly protein PilP [Mariprofundaceae bacterium]